MSIIQPIIGPLIEPIIRGIDAPLGGGSQSLTDQVRAALFSNGEQGGMWDATDMATLFQDSAGTTPVTSVTQPIGKMLDLSGNANYMWQATAGARPQYTADGALFDGVDDTMAAASASIPYAQSNGFTLAAAYSDKNNGTIGASVISASVSLIIGGVQYLAMLTRNDSAPQAWTNIRNIGDLTPSIPSASTSSGSKPADTVVSQVSWADSGEVHVKLDNGPVYSAPFAGDSSMAFTRLSLNESPTDTQCERTTRRALACNRSLTLDEHEIVRAWLMEGV